MGKGGGGGGAQPTSTTAYQTNLPEYAKPYVMNMLGAAQNQLFLVNQAGEFVEREINTNSTGAGALDHRVGEIHRRDTATGLADMAAHCLGRGPQRTAEIIESAHRLGVTGGHHTDGGDDVAVTRHRALDHIGKYVDDLFVKTEIPQSGDRGGKNLVFGLHAGAT